RVVAEIYLDGEFACSKEVRAVVSGKDGTILELNNPQDTYEKGDEAVIELTVVGPADKSTVSGAYAEIEITSGGSPVKSLKKEPITLSLEPQTLRFSFGAPADLERYELTARIGKGSKVFDEKVSEYEAFVMESILTEDGRVLPAGADGCFDDGKCTDEESKRGDCLDCVLFEYPEKIIEKERNSLFMKAVAALILVLLALVAVLRFRR
ncbi:MAG: hypothetical protein ACP5E4_03905, partial [Candidatus Aenigmatarchaeota archaeon]